MFLREYRYFIYMSDMEGVEKTNFSLPPDPVTQNQSITLRPPGTTTLLWITDLNRINVCNTGWPELQAQSYKILWKRRRLIETRMGVPVRQKGRYHAYIPKPLPPHPPVHFDDELHFLSEADRPPCTTRWNDDLVCA
jgi:hypothetical protein